MSYKINPTATNSTPGNMSAADKAKLDTFPTGKSLIGFGHSNFSDLSVSPTNPLSPVNVSLNIATISGITLQVGDILDLSVVIHSVTDVGIVQLSFGIYHLSAFLSSTSATWSTPNSVTLNCVHQWLGTEVVANTLRIQGYKVSGTTPTMLSPKLTYKIFR